MLSGNEILGKWNSMRMFNKGFMLVDSNHPLDIYIGYEELDQKTLLILNCEKLNGIPSSKSIIATNYQRMDGTWAISFKLIRKENEDVFVRLCWDIIESSRDANEYALETILQRYSKWHKLMEHGLSGLMNHSRQKGLIGELHFLKELLEHNGIITSVRSWIGPEGADKDFVLSSEWTEIKTIGLSVDSIEISSIEQLEGLRPGKIIIYFVDKTSIEDDKGFSLRYLVDELRDTIKSDSLAIEVFENKLMQYGYLDKDEYKLQKYRLGGRNEYAVLENFPCITRESVPHQITAVKYKISLASIEEYKI